MQVENFLADFNEQIKTLKGASTDAKRIVVTFNMYNKRSISVTQNSNGKWQITPRVEGDTIVFMQPYGDVEGTVVDGEAIQRLSGKIVKICIPYISDIEYDYFIEKSDIIEKLVAPSA